MDWQMGVIPGPELPSWQGCAKVSETTSMQGLTGHVCHRCAKEKWCCGCHVFASPVPEPRKGVIINKTWIYKGQGHGQVSITNNQLGKCLAGRSHEM